MLNRGIKAGVVVVGLLAAGGASAGAAGTFSAVFSPTAVPLNGTSTLTYTLTAYDDNRSLSFNVPLPAGVVVADPSDAFTDCGAPPAPPVLVPTITAVPGSSTVQFADGNTTTVYDGPFMGPRSYGCVVSVRVEGRAAGSHTLPAVSLLDGGFVTALTASAMLGVLAAPAASIPTLSEWGLILLVLALAASALNGMRRQRG